jgi:hypothetical protein
MATAENSDQAGSGAPVPGSGSVGDLKVLYGSIEIATALTINSVITLFTIPKGFTPMFGWLVGDDIDTGTEALEIDIGVTGDADKYLNSGVITGDTATPDEKITVGIRLPLQEDLMTVKPTKVAADIDCIATIVAAANAGGTGTVTVFLCGVYNDPRVV